MQILSEFHHAYWIKLHFQKRNFYTGGKSKIDACAHFPLQLLIGKYYPALANIILSREFSSLRPFLDFWAKEITLSARCSLKMITRRM